MFYNLEIFHDIFGESQKLEIIYLVGGLEHKFYDYFFSHILGMSSSQSDELHDFSEG
jgi:hypothetical protein